MNAKSDRKTVPANRAVAVGCAGLLLWLATAVQAGPYLGTPNPVTPGIGPLIPDPTQVTGKEYTDTPNKDSASPPNVDPHQVIAWDGTGGVADTFGLDSENLDALEAVASAFNIPEPRAVLLAGLGLLIVARRSLRFVAKT